MKKLFFLAALLPLALAACDGGQPAYQGDPMAQPAAAPAAQADHTLRDGLIGGALGYMAGRASQPSAAAVASAPTRIVHYTTHVYHPSDNRPAYVAPYRPSYRPSYSAPSAYRTTTTVTRSYRR